jgi:hypothetical protein
VSDFQAVIGAYEWQDRPLLILVDGSQLSKDSGRLGRLRRAVAMRGDAPYLGVLNSGRLTIYQVGLDDQLSDEGPAQLSLPAEDSATIPILGNTRPGISSQRWIGDVILRLLTESIDSLTYEGVSNEDAISLAGRALFVRFLADRDLLDTQLLPTGEADVSTLFDTVDRISKISRWLDDTFNGDFLPLSKHALKLTPQAISSLGYILRRAPGGQLHLGWMEKWDRLDFSQIPVGILSQAYERYLSKHEPDMQKREGGFYTPRHIAELMIRVSFHALRQEGVAHRARILDPAAGAGVFLLTAFRQLVAERWRSDGCRPSTSVLRSILYEQIAGFDINESALRFAALGLYLISIELDPDPEPLRKLRFSNLRPTVASAKGDLAASHSIALAASISGQDGFPAASRRMRSAIPFSA